MEERQPKVKRGVKEERERGYMEGRERGGGEKRNWDKKLWQYIVFQLNHNEIIMGSA